MNEEYFKKTFAYMFEDSSGQEPVTLFGFETHRGWDNLLFNLFNIIDIMDTGKNIRVRQVKTKLAGLRFYIEWVGPERKPTLHDRYVDLVKFLPWRIKRWLNYPSKKWDPDHKAIFDLIDLFESLSTRVCEDCGAPGKETSINGWLWVLCDKCLNERESMDALAEVMRNEKLLGSGHFQPEDV